MTTVVDIPMDPIVINSQPGGNDGSVIPIESRVTTGLGPLSSSDVLMIRQKLDACEILSGCEAQNRFTISGPAGELMYKAKEKSNFCNRFWCGNIRSMSMSVNDVTGNEVIRLSRPLTCSGCCCSFMYPHCTQLVDVSVMGQSVGSIRERATWCYPVYHVFDSMGAQIMKIRGPGCHYTCGTDVIFRVFRTNENGGIIGREIAGITKKWRGLCAETLLDAENYALEYDRESSVTPEEKALILSSTFLIDLTLYEQD